MCSMGNPHGTAVPTSDGHTEWLAKGVLRMLVALSQGTSDSCRLLGMSAGAWIGDRVLRGFTVCPHLQTPPFWWKLQACDCPGSPFLW